MLRFEGDQDFRRPHPEVWSKLTDARFLVSCLDGVQVIEADADQVTWKLKPAVSFVTGSLDVSLRINERHNDTGMAATVVSKGIGSSSTVVANLTFAPTDDGTRVRWSAEVTELTGLLKMVPKGLVQATAQKVIADVWADVKKKVEGGS